MSVQSVQEHEIYLTLSESRDTVKALLNVKCHYRKKKNENKKNTECNLTVT